MLQIDLLSVKSISNFLAGAVVEAGTVVGLAVVGLAVVGSAVVGVTLVGVATVIVLLSLSMGQLCNPGIVGKAGKVMPSFETIPRNHSWNNFPFLPSPFLISRGILSTQCPYRRNLQAS